MALKYIFCQFRPIKTQEDLVKNINSPMSPYMVITEDDDGRVSAVLIETDGRVRRGKSS